MAIVQAGKQFTADDIRQTAGNLASFHTDHIQSGMDFKTMLESWPDADMALLPPGPSGNSLTQPEIDVIKGYFIGDLPAIAAQLQASTWIKRLLGTGV